MNHLDVILRPLLTEKTNLLREGKNKTYVFAVDPRCNKYQVSLAVRALFSVTPLSCRIANVRGKAKSMGRRSSGFTSSWKKAYVTLAENQSIEKIEGV